MEPTVQQKSLGNTGVMVPEIGLGVWKYRGGAEPLRRGIELGAFLIDTAEMYRTEDIVGQAVKGIRDRKQVKYIGVSNFSTRELREAQAALHNYPIVSNQVLYNLNDREIERDLLPYCQKHNVTIIAYTPLDDGRLAVKSRWRRGQGMNVLAEIAAQTHKTLAQVALNWCLSRPNVIAIPKSDSVTRTEENCRASGWRLTPAQVTRLDEAFA